MIWLTWRQFRAQAIAAAAAVAVLGVIFGVTGPHLAHLYDISGLASCRTGCSALGTMERETTAHGQVEIADRLLALFPSMLLYWYHFSHSGKKIETATDAPNRNDRRPMVMLIW